MLLLLPAFAACFAAAGAAGCQEEGRFVCCGPSYEPATIGINLARSFSSLFVFGRLKREKKRLNERKRDQKRLGRQKERKRDMKRKKIFPPT